MNNLRSELEADRLRPDRIENPGDLLIGTCFFGGGFGVAGFGERGLSNGMPAAIHIPQNEGPVGVSDLCVDLG